MLVYNICKYLINENKITNSQIFGIMFTIIVFVIATLFYSYGAMKSAFKNEQKLV